MPIIKNKIFIYVVTRYLTYGLQFLLSLAIAFKLGPFYLGIYGVVMLFISYITQINLGIPHSLNVLLVHNKYDEKAQSKYAFNAFALFAYLSSLVLLGYVVSQIFGKNTWGEYDLTLYLPLIISISILTYVNSIFTTIIRFRNMVNLMSILGTIPVLLNLIVVVFFKEERLVIVLAIVNILSVVSSILVCIYKKTLPEIRREYFAFSTQREILHKGLFLFLYNSCFYFILIVVRTFVSRNYTIEEFGYFTFSYTLANSVMLLLESLNTIIFPKTIDMLSTSSLDDKAVVLNKLRIGYITTSHLLIYLALLCFPILVMIFTKYQPALTSMNMIALAVLMNTNSYGYNTLLIAQNKERISSRISLIALAVTIVSSFVLVNLLHIDFSLAILSMMLAYFIFSLIATYEGDKLLRGKASWRYTLSHFFPLKLLFPYSAALMISILKLESLIFVPLVLFLILNYKDLGFLKSLVYKMIKNPDVIDV